MQASYPTAWSDVPISKHMCRLLLLMAISTMNYNVYACSCNFSFGYVLSQKELVEASDANNESVYAIVTV
jgi:hypothetical protein